MPERDAVLKISYEDKDLIASGSVITFGPAPTTFEITVGNDHMRLVLEFSGDETDIKKTKAETEYIPPDTLKIRFLNFNDVFGAYPTEPSFLGTIENRKLWFAHVITALKNSKSKRLTYSFYLNKEAERAAD